MYHCSQVCTLHRGCISHHCNLRFYPGRTGTENIKLICSFRFLLGCTVWTLVSHSSLNGIGSRFRSLFVRVEQNRYFMLYKMNEEKDILWAIWFEVAFNVDEILFNVHEINDTFSVFFFFHFSRMGKLKESVQRSVPR